MFAMLRPTGALHTCHLSTQAEEGRWQVQGQPGHLVEDGEDPPMDQGSADKLIFFSVLCVLVYVCVICVLVTVDMSVHGYEETHSCYWCHSLIALQLKFSQVFLGKSESR